MSEGSLEAPTRHNIPWKEKDYLDPKKIDNELGSVVPFAKILNLNAFSFYVLLFRACLSVRILFRGIGTPPGLYGRHRSCKLAQHTCCFSPGVATH